MTLEEFEEHLEGENSIVLTTEENAESLAFEIDDCTIFENLIHGEYFVYKTTKVFTNVEAYELYGDYLRR
ncbi:MAG: hypothetical protein ACTSRU_10785, partial [Candidatus Hodarchaeales archaeon]